MVLSGSTPLYSWNPSGTELFQSMSCRALPICLLEIKTTSHLMNVTDAAAFRTLCEKERPTHVFHAAHPPRDESPSVINYCYHAMTNILEAAKEFGIKRVVYSSSASIYGQLKNRKVVWSKKTTRCRSTPLTFIARRKWFQNG